MPGYVKHRNKVGDEFSITIAPQQLRLECFLIEREPGLGSSDCDHVLEGDQVQQLCTEFGVDQVDYLMPLLDHFEDDQWEQFHEAIKTHQGGSFAWPETGWNR